MEETKLQWDMILFPICGGSVCMMGTTPRGNSGAKVDCFRLSLPAIACQQGGVPKHLQSTVWAAESYDDAFEWVTLLRRAMRFDLASPSNFPYNSAETRRNLSSLSNTFDLTKNIDVLKRNLSKRALAVVNQREEEMMRRRSENDLCGLIHVRLQMLSGITTGIMPEHMLDDSGRVYVATNINEFDCRSLKKNLKNISGT